jgi:hypothetical protein
LYPGGTAAFGMASGDNVMIDFAYNSSKMVKNQRGKFFHGNWPETFMKNLG